MLDFAARPEQSGLATKLFFFNSVSPENISDFHYPL
jgi:hypothetical protein